jgi:catechol 2,3-dioxygenase-like lactoylglutathione lyase family enzyme
MSLQIKSSRDVVLRTEHWRVAVQFYETVLGFKAMYRSEALVGFDTGAFVLYVEKGGAHGAIFDFLAPSVQAVKHHLMTAGCAIVEEDSSVPRCYL